jgi:hypothetical protein
MMSGQQVYTREVKILAEPGSRDTDGRLLAKIVDATGPFPASIPKKNRSTRFGWKSKGEGDSCDPIPEAH